VVQIATRCVGKCDARGADALGAISAHVSGVALARVIGVAVPMASTAACCNKAGGMQSLTLVEQSCPGRASIKSQVMHEVFGEALHSRHSAATRGSKADATSIAPNNLISVSARTAPAARTEYGEVSE